LAASRFRNNKFFYRVGLLAPRLTLVTLGDLGFSVRVYSRFEAPEIRLSPHSR
jgi:hypothetical protein